MSIDFASSVAWRLVIYNGVGYYAVYYIAFGLIALDIVLRLEEEDCGATGSGLEPTAGTELALDMANCPCIL